MGLLLAVVGMNILFNVDRGMKNDSIGQTLEDSPKSVDRRYLALSSFEISQIKSALVVDFL